MDVQPGTDGMANPMPAGSRARWVWSGVLIALGIAALFVLSVVEAQWLRQQPWGQAIRTEDYVIQDSRAIDSWSRELPLEDRVGDSEIVRTIQQDLVRKAAQESAREKSGRPAASTPVSIFDTSQMLDLSFLPKAWLVMLDLPAGDLAPLLGSGRLPVAGTHEVLAGPLMSADNFQLDGEAFTVVGQLATTVAGFTKTYVMPVDPALQGFFAEDRGGMRGSVLVQPGADLKTLIPELAGKSRDALPAIHGRPVQTRPFIAWGVWLSLLSVAAGATLGYITLYRWIAGTRIPLLSTAMRETVLRPRLTWGLHMALFFAFFLAMALGMRDAELNHLFTEYTAHTFTEGGLKYVGDAYQSGDISRAAIATFVNNFVVQTLMLTTGASLVPPFFWGVLKTALSFVVVGFAMAPIWSDTAFGMTYHAITLALELPPYILACFGGLVCALYILQFLWSPVRVWYLGDKGAGESIIEDAARQLPRGFMVLAGCTILSALFLFIAAWYEAATLILFR